MLFPSGFVFSRNYVISCNSVSSYHRQYKWLSGLSVVIKIWFQTAQLYPIERLLLLQPVRSAVRYAWKPRQMAQRTTRQNVRSVGEVGLFKKPTEPV